MTGCWFCGKEDGEMLFDGEFDTFLHEECLREDFAKGDNPEIKFMAYLLEEEV